MSETIHIHKQSSFDRGKLFFLMIPCLVFIAVLIFYLLISSYQIQIASSTSTQNVLGDNG